MALLIYSLCSVTALACAILLLLSARRTQSRMLLWSGLCFAGLTLTNLLVIADRYVFPNIDLSTLRLVSALIAILLLLYGLIIEER